MALRAMNEFDIYKTIFIMIQKNIYIPTEEFAKGLLANLYLHN